MSDASETIIPPAAPQPDVEEAELGVRGYWFEVFRRVVVIPDTKDCYVLSVDVHSLLREKPGFNVAYAFQLAQGKVRVYYLEADSLKHVSLAGRRPSYAYLVVVYAQTPTGMPRLEAVNVRLRYCGLDKPPSRDDVWSVYREVVRVVENRDPETSPLRAPEPIKRVYASRLSG